MYNSYKKILIFALVISFSCIAHAQSNTEFFKDAIKAKRDTFYNRTLRSIQKTFLLPLDESTEENWQSTFYNINLLNYKSKKVDEVVKNIATKIVLQSDDCKKAFLDLINNRYPKAYFTTVQKICNSTENAKLQAMCIHYLLGSRKTTADDDWIKGKFKTILTKNDSSTIISELEYEVESTFRKMKQPGIFSFFDSSYLPNTTIVFSFQRKNRDYPGLAMIRKADGTFLKNSDGTYFAVGQLARSISNMPGYISNGNTPQGIFTMHGFDTSKNYFIGPSSNIQLSMPHEYNSITVNGDIVDTSCTLEQYRNLLPKECRDYAPLYGTFYAGKAGRTEIIAHGTTINPSYYSTCSYYPFTPTMGCLTSVEIWDSKTGYLQKSNQQKLTDALQKNGGAIGYLIVVEINHNSKENNRYNYPVTLEDLNMYLPK
jgi:hypothetical protein